MRTRSLPSIDVHAAARGDDVLLDVREPFEWAAGHPARAVHIPLGDLPRRVGELPRGTRVVCMCRSGNRSADATAWLRARGHDAVDMTGGMRAWAAAGLPLVDGAGRPGVVA